MESLITKNINYIGIRNSLKEDEAEIQKFINTIESPSVKDRIIKEAKEFYAQKFNVSIEDIWYGDISNRYPECKNPFPYSHVIGSIDLGSSGINMSKLVYCRGINSTGVAIFENLETIDGIGNFNGTAVKTSLIKHLPKLKHAPYLYCANSHLRTLALEESVSVNLTKSKIEKINLRVVSCELSVAFSPIKDITSLLKVGKFNCRGTNIEHVNPYLQILGDLILEDSNHFEKKLIKYYSNADLNS